MSWKLLIAALGAVVEIDLTGLTQEQASAVSDAWKDALAAEGQADASATVLAVPGDDAPHDPDALLADLSQRVTLAAISARRGELWMLHAAGVAASDGRVVALVGPSGRGKTTAARALAARFAYVSDETVAIDADGRVWPYRKPLSIIEEPGRPKVQRAASSLGLLPLPDAPLRLAAIAVLDRREDARDEASVEVVDLGDVLAELVEQSSHLTAMPAPLRTIAAHGRAVGGMRRIVYREAASLLPVVEALVAAPLRDVLSIEESSEPDHGPGEPDHRPGAERSVASAQEEPRYRRGQVHDELTLEDPDRIAVLQRGAHGTGTVRVLAGIAPALWRAAQNAPLERLVSAAVAEFGAPADADAAGAVARAVTDLVDAGVLLSAPGCRQPQRDQWGIRPDVAWTDSGDRIVALALADESATPVALEGSAAVVWSALATGRAPVTDIIARAAEAVGVEPETIAADVTGFLDDLESATLVDRR